MAIYDYNIILENTGYYAPYLLEVAYQFWIYEGRILSKYNIEDATVEVMLWYYRRVYDIISNGENYEKDFVSQLTFGLLCEVYADYTKDIADWLI